MSTALVRAAARGTAVLTATYTAAELAARSTQIASLATSRLSAFQGTPDDNVPQQTDGYYPKNPNYQTHLMQIGNGRTVTGTAPLEIDLQLQNNYVDFMTLIDSAIGGLGGPTSQKVAALLSAVSATAGVGNQARIASYQIWGGTQPLEFNLPIMFKMHTDPLREVIQPARNLLYMASPEARLGGALLDSPGPSLIDAMKAISRGGSFFTSLDNSIFLRIGRRFSLAGLIITSLSLRVSNRAHRKTGLPISIEAAVGFKTVASYSRQEILSAFYGSSFGTVPYGTNTISNGGPR